MFTYVYFLRPYHIAAIFQTLALFILEYSTGVSKLESVIA